MSDTLRGILAMLVACLTFTVGDAIMKLASATLPVGQMLFVRGLITLAILAVAIHLTGALAQWQPHYLAPTLLRSFGEIISTVMFFIGLTQIAFNEASAIGQMAPLLVTAGAALFLNEQVGVRRWLATLVGFIGVLLIVRPGGESFTWGAVFIFASTVGVAFRDLVTRQMPRGVPTLVLAFGAGACVTLAGLGMRFWETWVAMGMRESLLLLTSATTVIVGYVAIITASRHGDISVVSPFRYSAILFGVLIGMGLFGERIAGLTILGIVLIIAAGLYTLWRERVRHSEGQNLLSHLQRVTKSSGTSHER